jgi:hypothetical protein
MYELFDEAEREGQAFLIRIAQNRKTVKMRSYWMKLGKNDVLAG